MKPGEKKKVLLVEDDSLTTSINRKVIEMTNLAQSIEFVNNGFEALHLLENKSLINVPLPELLFLDINMPFMNGFEFIRAIQGHQQIDHRQLCMVILSSSFDPGDKAQAKDLGIPMFIEKPLTVTSAIEALMLR